MYIDTFGTLVSLDPSFGLKSILPLVSFKFGLVNTINHISMYTHNHPYNATTNVLGRVFILAREDVAC
jgi:hypothetical protein